MPSPDPFDEPGQQGSNLSRADFTVYATTEAGSLSRVIEQFAYRDITLDTVNVRRLNAQWQKIELSVFEISEANASLIALRIEQIYAVNEVRSRTRSGKNHLGYLRRALPAMRDLFGTRLSRLRHL